VTAAVALAGGSRRCSRWTLPQGRKATPSAALASLLLLLLLLPVCTLAVSLSPVGVSPVGVSPVGVSQVHCSRRLQLSAARLGAALHQHVNRWHAIASTCQRKDVAA
jgi:hypothetical protein